MSVESILKNGILTPGQLDEGHQSACLSPVVGGAMMSGICDEEEGMMEHVVEKWKRKQSQSSSRTMGRSGTGDSTDATVRNWQTGSLSNHLGPW